ncbi:N-formylglutamate deformylase [Fulvivirga sp. RKSG066]|uniref:N-formylglutamate amidohydrolase n=1 Tax=Fulvivirga aurantia TaxID=2529383 RepID=UPI0012BC28D6|nr:N-formylglutamate amidohydrolase [Fulvivirga aurantia]MTI21226.1 N-formylglutamate deformylase [Fulvivirga aurantia]
MEPYHIIKPSGKKVPILISSPHSGTAFPDELKEHYDQEKIQAPEDTDWFIDKLYDFAPEMGITMITAKYSRWVIDLNRDPESRPLYDDGRIITDLCPTMSFSGNPIYNEDDLPDREEIERRINTYYWPYYRKIEILLKELKEEFGQVLFWDAHSIKQYVPTIREEVFPDLILGDNNEKTASPELIKAALETLEDSRLKVNHNDPFKGGHLTRYFGKPDQNQHALQLEMTKINYMDNAEKNYHGERADIVRSILKSTFESLIKTLSTK